MTRPNRLALALSLALAIGAPAQPVTAQSSDETAIRQLRPESAAYTDDAFFFSGAYARPIIGSQARETAPRRAAASTRTSRRRRPFRNFRSLSPAISRTPMDRRC